VTLTVTAGLDVSPTQLSFTSGIGGSPTSQTISVTHGTNASYASTATTQQGNWLMVTPSSGSTPGTLTVTANPTGLAAGTYTGSVQVTASGQTQTIPVRLTISEPGGGTFSLQPSSLVFSYQIGGTTPAASTVSISSTQAATFSLSPITTNGGNWLSVTPATGSLSNSAQHITISVNPAGLAAGTYTGQIQAFSGGLVAARLPVTLTVTGSSGVPITVSPSSLSFQAGTESTATLQQTLAMTSPSPTAFTVSAGSVGNWLLVTPETGSINPITALAVLADPAGLLPGTYSGTVTITAPGQPPLVVPVTLVITSGSGTTLNVTPSALTFNMQPGGTLPPNQVLRITSLVPTFFQVTSSGISNNTIWLLALPNAGQSQTSGTTITVGVISNQLTAGDYRGTIAVTATGQNPITIPVVLNVGTLTITTNSLPAGSLRQSYNQTLAASTNGVTWNIASGSLPAGLSLNSTSGAITGKPEMFGAFTFTVRATDSTGASGTSILTLEVLNNPWFHTTKLRGTTVSTAYVTQLEVSGGAPPYTFTQTGLADGLTLNATSGLINGTPETAGTFRPVVTVRDSSNRTATETFSLVVQRPPLKTTFVPLPPCRIMETRAEYNYQGRTGAFGPPFLNANETRTLTLPASNVCQVPTSAKAYVLNVTLIPRAPVDFVTVYPGDEERPQFWTVRSPDQQIVANSAIVRAGTGGTLKVYSSGAADVLIDISGYFTDSTTANVTHLTFYPVTPCRAIETRSDYRSPAGPFGPPSINTAETRRFRIPSSPHCTIPSNAAAYSATLTVVPPGPLAYLTAWPAGQAQPNISSINSFAGRVLANSLIIPSGTEGAIDVFAYDRTDVIVDINGYFAPDDGANGLYFYPLVQCRIGEEAYTDETTRTIPIQTSTACVSIPASVKAYALNFTALPNGSPMPFLTAYPTGQPRPNASVLNAFQGQVVSNSALIPAGTGGAIDIFAFRRTDVAVEIAGYFAR